MDAAVSSCCSRRKVRNIGHLCKDCRRMKILGVIAVTFVQAIVQLIGSIRMKVMLILCEGEDVRSSISPKIAAIYLKFAAVLHFDCWTEPIWWHWLDFQNRKSCWNKGHSPSQSNYGIARVWTLCSCEIHKRELWPWELWVFKFDKSVHKRFLPIPMKKLAFGWKRLGGSQCQLEKKTVLGVDRFYHSQSPCGLRQPVFRPTVIPRVTGTMRLGPCTRPHTIDLCSGPT